jgi:hypothetical protein
MATAVSIVPTAMCHVHPSKNKKGAAVVDNTNKPKRWGVLLLFASIPTLLCCALPILLVSLGMGSVVASLYGDKLPFLQWFGRNEEITFGATAAILLFAGWILYRSGRTCPTDPLLAQACKNADTWNRRFYWFAVAVWCIGVFAANAHRVFS